MDGNIIKKNILIAIIVLVNIILIILTSISVIKSVKRIENGETVSNAETNIAGQDEIYDKQDGTLEDQTENDNDLNISADSMYNNLMSIKEYINMQNLQLCILIIIGINLLILAIIIYRKIR